jgi:hypothetical protein
MDESHLKKNCKDPSFLTDLQITNTSISELDILRKAYEMILENSDLFFKELGKSFSNESENGEFKPLI